MGIKEFEPAVLAALPGVVAVVPREPAARLGRWTPKGGRSRGMRVRTALDELGDVLAERLLGALELTVDRLAVDIPHDLVAGLVPSTAWQFGGATLGGERTSTKEPVTFVETLHPGAADLVVDLVTALRDLAAVPDAAGDEAEIAARHGAAHLALAVVVSAAVLRSLHTVVAGNTAAIIGVALGAAALVLPTAPKPPAYAAAALARRRAEYVLPRSSARTVTVTGHRFSLTEGAVPATTDFSANGLVAAVADGVVVRTGVATGHVWVMARVLTAPPDEVELTGWDEVVEIGWTAPAGGAVLSGDTSGKDRRWEAPPWPGDFRVRVHMAGRDDAEDVCHLVMWQAPPAPEVVHRRTDRLGHRLRGEPEPPHVVAPDVEHRWIGKSSLSAAATITVVLGLTEDEVITTFGGDPAAPVPLGTTWHGRPAPLLTVLTVDDVVLAVEDNGYQGAHLETLTALSREGKAASLYWNVNGNFVLTIAEGGEPLFAGDPGHDPGAPHTDGLDFAGLRHRKAKGLTVLARFAGRGITQDDLNVINAADRAYVLGGTIVTTLPASGRSNRGRTS
jgi:hypothetical protein